MFVTKINGQILGQKKKVWNKEHLFCTFFVYSVIIDNILVDDKM